MKLVIADTVFEEFPELVLGVVILHNIDNSQNRAEIIEMLQQAEAALPGKFGSTPIVERPYIATVKQYCGGTVSTAFLDKDNREIKLI